MKHPAFKFEVFRPAEVSKRLGVSVSTITGWINSGKMTAHRVGCSLFVPGTEVDRVLRKCNQPIATKIPAEPEIASIPTFPTMAISDSIQMKQTDEGTRASQPNQDEDSQSSHLNHFFQTSQSQETRTTVKKPSNTDLECLFNRIKSHKVIDRDQFKKYLAKHGYDSLVRMVEVQDAKRSNASKTATA